MAKSATNRPTINFSIQNSIKQTKLNNLHTIKQAWHREHSTICSFTTNWHNKACNYNTFPTIETLDRKTEVRITKLRMNLRDKTYVHSHSTQFCTHCSAFYSTQHYLNCPAGKRANFSSNLTQALSNEDFHLNNNNQSAIIMRYENTHNYIHLIPYISKFIEQR